MAERLPGNLCVATVGVSGRLSASLCAAERGAHGALEHLVREADAWMYRAKRAGRGRVFGVGASGPEPPAMAAH